MMNMIITAVYIRRTMMLRIERSDGTPPYEAKYSGTFMLGEIPGPGACSTSAWIRPTQALRIRRRDNPIRIATTTFGVNVVAQNDPTVAEQLQQLDDMHRSGWPSTDDEFAAAKQRVLRG